MIFLETIIIRCKIKFCIQHSPRSKYQEEILELTTDFTYVSRCSEKMTQNPRFSIERSLFFSSKLFSRPYRHIERKKIEKKTLSKTWSGSHGSTLRFLFINRAKMFCYHAVSKILFPITEQRCSSFYK